MIPRARRFPALVLIALVTALLVSTAGAQDGPIRKRLKERLIERQKQKPAPEASTDVGTPITAPGDYTFSIEHGGLRRMYRVHVPAKLDLAQPAPVLFALHGGGGSMEYQANDNNYGLIGKSDREGFVVVFPNGFSRFQSGQFATWNAGRCCGGARDENIDDVGFIRRVFDTLTHQVNVDRRHVFATGMSNGGLMSYRLACEMSDVFKAIAPVAGTDNTRSCSPANPVSVLHIHAKNDPHVLFTGGAGPEARDKSKVTEFTSVPDTIAKWVKLDGCSATPRRVLDKPGAYCEVYTSCRGKAEVQLCVTEAGGHSWPGGHKSRGESPSQAISADDVMWEFFSRQ